MRIGLDATVTAQRRIVGISRFVVNLVHHFAASNVPNQYVLCYRPRALRHPRCIWRPPDPRFRVRLLQRPLSRRLLRSLDVYHATDQRLPPEDGLVPYLVTVHDIFYLSEPEQGSSRTRMRWQARYRDVGARAQLMMTVSEFSKGEVVRLLGVAPERVRVIPLAASSEYVPQSQAAVAAMRQRYGLDRPYILFGGGFGRRKNPLGAVRAFALAAPRLPDDVCLVVAGTGGTLEAETRACVRDANLTARVQFIGFVPGADHPALISGSLVYFFPSLFEGFGLPALEAMACGAPLLTTSTTALPEVCGDAARLVDSADVPVMADALVELTRTPSLRDALRARGFARVKQYTWPRVADAVLRLYAELA